MDIHHNEFTFIGLLLKQINNLLSICRREAGSRLIEEKHRWFADKLQSNIQTLALSARDVFIDSRANLKVFGSIEAQIL